MATSASTDAGANETELASPQGISEQEIGEYREQDRVLPIANIARIMKNAVPMTSKISKEAKEAVQDCISEFISFITSEAAEKCHDEKRKTIGGEDVLYAMMLLGLEQYVEPLKIHLAKMRTPAAVSANGMEPEPQMEEEQAETPFA